MFKIWDGLSNIGIQSIKNESNKSQVILLNRLNVLVSIIYIIIGVIYFSFNDYKTGIFITFLIIINIIALGLQKKSFRLFSQSLFLITSYLSIFYFDSYAGLDSGAYFYYLPVILSLFFIFNMKKEKPFVIFHTLIVVLLCCINFFTNHQLFKSDIVTTKMQSNLLFANSIFSIVSVLYFGYLILLRYKFKINR